MEFKQQIKISFFGNFYDKQPMVRTLADVLILAASEPVKKQTLEIRRLRAMASDEATPIGIALEAKNNADRIKKNLPSFMTNVLCEHGKTRKDIVSFLPFVGFDVDHITETEVIQLMQTLVSDPHVIIAEPSCSRTGVHFVLFTDTDEWLNQHWDGKDTKPYEFVWSQAKAYVDAAFQVEVDVKCQNPEHIFGICYDDLLHHKEEPIALHIDTDRFVSFTPRTCLSPIANAHSGTYRASINDVAELITRHIEQRGIHFTIGSRNDFVLRFALACNQYGVSQCETEDFCINNFEEPDFKEAEILATIRSAYKKTDEHGTFCAPRANAQPYEKTRKEYNALVFNNGNPSEQTCANAQTAQITQKEENNISFQHTFSDKIPAEDWCAYFTPVLNSMDDTEGKDKMILGTLVNNSGIIPNYYGIYGGHTVYPPLYILFYGPSASRKGEIGSCQFITKPLKNEINAQYQQEMDGYRAEHAEWEAKSGKAADKAHRGEEPQEPEYRSPIIPANSSASAAYLALKANGGWGIMFETEASALTQSLLSDYGDYSTGLLAAFHHEPIKMNRVKDKVRFDIDEPRLAIGLTCTAGQLPKLFPTFEDGLGNRFLYYGLNRKLVWNNPFKKMEKTLDEVYEDLGEQSLELYHLMTSLGKRRIQFLLKDEQIEEFNTFFSDLLMEQFALLGDGITSFIFRLGLSTFRIAMTLTLLRRFSDWDKSKPFFADNEQALLCNDKDFNIAMTIMNTLVNHTATIYAALAKDDEGLINKDMAVMTPPERILFEALKDEFTTEEVKDVSMAKHINPETARRYIGKYVNDYHVAERVKNGLYRKIQK